MSRDSDSPDIFPHETAAAMLNCATHTRASTTDVDEHTSTAQSCVRALWKARVSPTTRVSCAQGRAHGKSRTASRRC